MDINNTTRESADDAIWDNLAKGSQNGDFGVVFGNNFEDFGGIPAEINRDASRFGGFFDLVWFARVRVR